jgi:hypothetical protein
MPSKTHEQDTGQESFEDIIDPATGEKMIRTGFGIEKESDLAEWDQLSTGMGDKVDFATEPVFVGYLTGEGETEGTNANGEVGMAPYYSFRTTDGVERFVWKTYQLDEALEGLPQNGTKLVRIEHLGKRSIKGGKQSVNVFKMAVKRT